MKYLKLKIDYNYCPKGHADWVFITASTLYPDIFWCERCDTFYEPSVKPKSKEQLNKDFSSDRAGELIKYAEFLQWKSKLTTKDMIEMGIYRTK